MNTTHEIAARLSSLCSELKFVEAYTELFSDHAESIDPVYGNVPLKGLPELIERENKFLSTAQIHEIKMSEPILAGNYFSIILSMRATINGQEERMLEELCVYKIENGKIVSQQFFIG